MFRVVGRCIGPLVTSTLPLDQILATCLDESKMTPADAVYFPVSWFKPNQADWRYLSSRGPGS